jgi:hypothetical protein
LRGPYPAGGPSGCCRPGGVSHLCLV